MLSAAVLGLATSPKMTVVPVAAPMVPFEDWAESVGIDAPKLAVTGMDELRGVLVLEDVAAGEELCCVPRTACLDLSAVEGAASPCEPLVPTELWTRLRWYQRLSCWLLAERLRGAASPVIGYLGYLPDAAQFANSPLEWSDEELAELCYPPVAAGVREQGMELEALYSALQRAGGPMASSVSLAELRWASQLVLSRAFTSTIATPKELAKRAPPPPPAPPSPAAVTARMWFGSLPVIGGLVNEKPPPPPPPPIGDTLDMAMMPMLDAFNHFSGTSYHPTLRYPPLPSPALLPYPTLSYPPPLPSPTLSYPPTLPSPTLSYPPTLSSPTLSSQGHPTPAHTTASATPSSSPPTQL